MLSDLRFRLNFKRNRRHLLIETLTVRTQRKSAINSGISTTIEYFIHVVVIYVPIQGECEFQTKAILFAIVLQWDILLSYFVLDKNIFSTKNNDTFLEDTTSTAFSS